MSSAYGLRITGVLPLLAWVVRRSAYFTRMILVVGLTRRHGFQTGRVFGLVLQGWCGDGHRTGGIAPGRPVAAAAAQGQQHAHSQGQRKIIHGVPFRGPGAGSLWRAEEPGHCPAMDVCRILCRTW